MGPLLSLDTFTTAIMVSTKVRAIIVRREADEGVRTVMALVFLSVLIDRWREEIKGQDWEERSTITVVRTRDVSREGKLRVWSGERATK